MWWPAELNGVRSRRVGVEHVRAAGGMGALLHASVGVVHAVLVSAVAARLTAGSGAWAFARLAWCDVGNAAGCSAD